MWGTCNAHSASEHSHQAPSQAPLWKVDCDDVNVVYDNDHDDDVDDSNHDYLVRVA